ncbi:WD repeat-containing protein 87 [Anopheles bellator]|uniref:WD repeat-containing protein 87 n=1 Tax=Anopheles bellator TaxID=139047 RepID=UPI0026482C23|nr:WD repeat-containing protein 87 [Anopheles bellator]
MSSNKLPRRTQELDLPAPQSSIKKPQNRASRIAQPVRKSAKPTGLSEIRRSRSMDRGLNVLPLPTTATKKSLNPRSSSATPQLRTPMRSGGLHPADAVPPSTAERERCTVDAALVFDYLAVANIADLPREFVERGNMKSMSMKQFLIIVAHLLRQIGGSRYKIGANFVEDIVRAITELQCPFTINKSMLKTPTAPYSMGPIVSLLTWLIQLAPQPRSEAEWAPTLVKAEEFPSTDFTRFFYQSSIECFHLWNMKREEEFEAKVETVVDRLVACKTGGLTQAEVQQRTEQIVRQLEAIGKESGMGPTREQSLDGVQREIAERMREESRLVEEVKRLSKQVSKQEQQQYRRQDEYYDCESAIHKLKEELAQQQMTIRQRDEMCCTIALKERLIAAKHNALHCLEEASSDHQIKLSHMIQQKIDGLTMLNTQLHNFANALESDITFTPMELNRLMESRPEELAAALSDLDQQLNDVFNQQRQLFLKLSAEKCLYERQVNDAQLMLAPLEMAVAEQSERLAKLHKQRDAIMVEFGSLATRIAETKVSRKKEEDLALRIEQIKANLARNENAIEKLGRHKQQLMQNALMSCQRAISEKDHKRATLVAQLDHCEAIMKKIVDVLKISTEEPDST